MLTRVIKRIAAAYQPDPFKVSQRVKAVTLAELEAACSWAELRSEFDIPETATALSLSGLRFSRLFPELFLYRSDGDGSQVLTVNEAAALVRRAAEQYPLRSEASPAHPCTV